MSTNYLDKYTEFPGVWEGAFSQLVFRGETISADVLWLLAK